VQLKQFKLCCAHYPNKNV